MTSRSNPITPQSPVVINGYFDRSFCTWRQRNGSSRYCAGSPYEDTSVENFVVQPRELAFKLIPEYDKMIQRPANTAGYDGAPRIFTTANGFPFFNAADGKKDVHAIRALRDDVVFVGTTLTALDAGNANQKDSIAITVAGSTTIINTGPRRIAAGQLIMWDFPRAIESMPGQNELVRINSVPRNKALFMTLPVERDEGGLLSREAEDLLATVVSANARGDPKRPRRTPTDLDLVAEDYRAMQAADGGFDEAAATFIKSFTLLLAAQHRRVIGIALSSAESGEPIDVLLRGGGAF